MLVYLRTISLSAPLHVLCCVCILFMIPLETPWDPCGNPCGPIGNPWNLIAPPPLDLRGNPCDTCGNPLSFVLKHLPSVWKPVLRMENPVVRVSVQLEWGSHRMAGDKYCKLAKVMACREAEWSTGGRGLILYRLRKQWGAELAWALPSSRAEVFHGCSFSPFTHV